MTDPKETAQGAAEAASEAVDSGKKTKEELKKAKLQAIGQELKMLQEDLREGDKKERAKKIWDRVKGIAVIAFFGKWMKKKDVEQMEADEKDVHVSEETETEEPEREEVVLRVLLTDEEKEEATESEEELSMVEGDEYYGEPGKKEWLVNMANGAKPYYTNSGKLRKSYQKKLKSGEITADEIPDKYLFSGRGIFSDIPSTYEEFRDRLVAKWFPHAKDKDKAVEQCTNILRRCALGRFQVLPKYHFKKMGWESEGEQGLRDMFGYLNSPKNQFQLFERGIKSSITKFSQPQYKIAEVPVLIAIAYYSGEGVKKYMSFLKEFIPAKKELSSGGDPIAIATRLGGKFTYKFYDKKTKTTVDKDLREEYKAGEKTAEQVLEASLGLKHRVQQKAYKNHGSLLGYGKKAKRYFNAAKKQGFSFYESVAIAIERIESNGTYSKRMFLARRTGKTPETTSGPEIARVGNRVLAYPVSEEGKKLLAHINPDEGLVTVAEYKEYGRKFDLKESAAKALELANELAAKDGYHIAIFSGYRTAEQQAEIKKGTKGNRWVASAGGSWHQSGGTADVFLHKIGSEERLSPTRSQGVADSTHTKLLEKYMNAAGFVRYDAEAWHFEIGSSGWAKIMQSQGILEKDTLLADATYVRDQLGEDSHHHKEVA